MLKWPIVFTGPSRRAGTRRLGEAAATIENVAAKVVRVPGKRLCSHRWVGRVMLLVGRVGQNGFFSIL
jgi:hypothetical protein